MKVEFDSSPEIALVITTENDLSKAKELAESILKMRVAACISFNKVQSKFFWRGDLVEEFEIQMLIKTKTSKLDSLYEELCRLHSYDTPEFIFFPASSDNMYSAWVQDVIGNNE